MKAAVLHEHGAAPACSDDFDEPVPGDGQAVADVAAAGINHLDLLKASGGFYTGPPPLPVGWSGVTAWGGLRTGGACSSTPPSAPHGAMAERTLVREDALLDIPDGVDDDVAAGARQLGPRRAGWRSSGGRA